MNLFGGKMSLTNFILVKLRHIILVAGVVCLTNRQL